MSDHIRAFSPTKLQLSYDEQQRHRLKKKKKDEYQDSNKRKDPQAL